MVAELEANASDIAASALIHLEEWVSNYSVAPIVSNLVKKLETDENAIKSLWALVAQEDDIYSGCSTSIIECIANVNGGVDRVIGMLEKSHHVQFHVLKVIESLAGHGLIEEDTAFNILLPRMILLLSSESLQYLALDVIGRLSASLNDDDVLLSLVANHASGSHAFIE
jgi:hypothetical protein